MLSETSSDYMRSVTSKHYEEGQNMSGIGAWVLEKIGMKRSDYLLLIFITLIGSYLFNLRDRVSLQPAFFQPIPTDKYSNGFYPQAWERFSRPIVTDLEIDGENEVILSFPDGHIVVAKFALVTPEANYPLPRLEKVFEYDLSESDGQKRHALSVETGFLEPYKAMGQIRKQVIAVLTNDSNLFLLTSNLKLQFQRALGPVSLRSDSPLFLKESSLLILSRPTKQGDLGTVVVGASLDIPESFQRDGSRGYTGRQEEHNELLHHFSLYALDGRTGEMRWSHEPGDFEVHRRSPFPNYSHFKFTTGWSGRHMGEQAWTSHKNAFRRALPYSWHSPYDSKLRVDKIGSPGPKLAGQDGEEFKYKTLFDLDQEYVAGLLFGGLRPHSPSERVQSPDALFIYSQRQLQLLDLATGRPLSALQLQSDSVTLGDISGDGEIEEVRVELRPDTASESDRVKKSQEWVTLRGEELCHGQVHTLTGVSRRFAWEGELCSHPHGLDNLASSFASHVTLSVLDVLRTLGREKSDSEQDHKLRQLKLQLWGEEQVDVSELQALPPMLIPSTHYSHTPFKLHFTKTVSNNFQVGGATSYDVIFVLSNGRVSSFGPEGHLNWQTYVSADWSDAMPYRRKFSNSPPSGEQGLLAHSFVPHAAPLSSLSYGQESHLLLVGMSFLSVLSLEDGVVESEIDLPCTPIAPSVIADFDSNGVNDVIVMCRDNYIGFRLSHTSGKSYTTLITFLISGLVFVVLMHYRGSAPVKQEAEPRPDRRRHQD